MFKPLTMSAQTTFVSSADPSIDWDAIVIAELEADQELRDAGDKTSEQKRSICTAKFFSKYSDAVIKNPGAWRDLLKIKQGEQPTEFVIGVIPPEEMSRIADECRLGRPDQRRNEAQWRAFLNGIRDVKGFGSGQVPKRKVGDIEYVDPVWLRTNFSRGLRDVALGVGLVIWAWNGLTEEETKN